MHTTFECPEDNFSVSAYFSGDYNRSNFDVLSSSYKVHINYKKKWILKDIEVVANCNLFDSYICRRKELKMKNERYLWHGCAQSVVNDIALNGFGRNYTHKGCLLGDGVYFACGSGYSFDTRFAKTNNTFVKKIILARVTLGDNIGVGHSGSEVAKDSKGNLYTSVTDDEKSMYCILNAGADRQAYPEFVMTFEQVDV